MAELILGLRCNELVINTYQLKIDSDQSGYDYICNVALSDSWNGNGTYDVLIYNKEKVQGLPIGKWRLSQASITYDWGSSSARFRIIDETGLESNEIIASTQNGSANSYGFSILGLTLSIFAKATKIVGEYPSVSILNAVMEFDYKAKKIKPNSYADSFRKTQDEPNDFLDFIDSISGEISAYMSAYKKVKKLLETSDDVRADLLLTRIKNDSRNLMMQLKAKLFLP